jgi:hypothetical protein
MGLFSRKPTLPDVIPPGHWSMVQGAQDGQLLLARVHMGIDSLVGHRAYPFRVGIATRMINVVNNGMPTPEENATLQALEKRIQQAIEVDREAVLVIVITCAGVKEWVFYTSKPESTKQRTQAFAPTVQSHKLQMIIERDDRWTVYREFANPRSTN